MNIYQLAHRVNWRLNGNDERIFPVILIILSEILYIFKHFSYLLLVLVPLLPIVSNLKFILAN